MKSQVITPCFKNLCTCCGVLLVSLFFTPEASANYYPPCTYFRPNAHARLPIRNRSILQQINQRIGLDHFSSNTEKNEAEKTNPVREVAELDREKVN